ncbi:type II toxin-antitoxin system RelE/ParE family toxin [Marinihelvus fidelis]|uniref:type II toxin-antitoxin system RelE/ParE family toxin n=1 Tax=Marinihelvus fidelis TaxID=2613842 RepID=UPI003872C90D
MNTTKTSLPEKGLEFLAAVESGIDQLCQYPESGPVKRGMIRSLVLPPSGRWPYSLHYSIKPAEIRVLAVAHHRRQPFYWLGKRV